jgi:hypothetical protein
VGGGGGGGVGGGGGGGGGGWGGGGGGGGMWVMVPPALQFHCVYFQASMGLDVNQGVIFSK